MLILSRGTHFPVIQPLLPSIRPVPVSDQQNFNLMFRADLKIGEKLSIPKKRILFQLPFAWFNGLIALRRLVEV